MVYSLAYHLHKFTDIWHRRMLSESVKPYIIVSVLFLTGFSFWEAAEKLLGSSYFGHQHRQLSRSVI